MLRVILIVTILSTVNAATIKVGSTVSLKPNDMDAPGAISILIISIPTIAGYQMGIDYVNRELFPMMIDGVMVDSMELVMADDHYDPEVAKTIYKSWIDEGTVDLFMAPYTTISDPYDYLPEDSLTQILEDNEKIFLSGNSPFTSFSRFPRQWSFTVDTTLDYYMMGTVLPLRTKGVSTAVFLSSSVAVIGMCDDKLEQLLKESNIEVIGQEFYNDGSATQRVPYYEYSKELLNELKELTLKYIEEDPDAWYICTSNPKIPKYMRDVMYEHDYTPRAMISICSDDWKDYEGYNETKAYMLCIASDRSDTKVTDPRFGTLDEFKQTYSKYADPESYNYYATTSALSVAIYGELLQIAGTKDQHILREYLRRYSTNTYKGKISWDAFHDQQNSGFIIQANISNIMNTIMPYEARITDHVYPEPKWHERTYDPNRYRVTSIILGVIAGFCILVNIGWAVFVIVKWNTKTIKASSPIFVMMCLVGSTILYLSVYFSAPTYRSIAGCHLNNWSLLLGFSLLFVPLCAKTWRVYKLFADKSLRIIVITNTQVFITVCITIVPLLALMCALTIVYPSDMVRVVLDINAPYHDYYSCPTNTASTGLMATIMTLGALIMLSGMIFAILVWNIPYRVYNESKYIAFAIYNVAIFAILMCIVQLGLDISHIAKYRIFSSLLIVSNLITVMAIMIHKLVYLNNPNSMSGSGSTMKSTELTDSTKPAVSV